MTSGMVWWAVAAGAVTAAVWVPGTGVGGPSRPGARVVEWVRSHVRMRRRDRPDVLGLLDGLAAELVAGQPTPMALIRAAGSLRSPPCPLAVRAARSGGDVAEALRRDAAVPGASELRGLAACWEVAEHSGAGMSRAVEHLASGVRRAAAARGDLDAEVSAARASARVLAGLPVVGLVVGHWLGAAPLSWFVSSPSGVVAIVMGVGLQVGGLLWLRFLVTGAVAGI